MVENIENEILSRIASDIYAADLCWSLFLAAARNYRFDSVLRPFPPFFLKKDTEEKDIEALRDVALNLPPLTGLSHEFFTTTSTTVDLLNWVLTCGSVYLQQKERKEFTTIQKLTGQVIKTPSPNYVFEVVYGKNAEERFRALQRGRTVWYAYHGSRLENFHSILHNGLNAHLNKNALFGSGTYLSSELGVSLPYSPTGSGWENSILGSKLSCVAVCEIIDHPTVKCHTRDASQLSRAYSKDSLAGQVPEKYYLVQNNDMVRVRYLLVYISAPSTVIPNKSVILKETWWKNRFTFVMVCYIVVLIAIGLSTSPLLQRTLSEYFH